MFFHLLTVVPKFSGPSNPVTVRRVVYVASLQKMATSWLNSTEKTHTSGCRTTMTVLTALHVTRTTHVHVTFGKTTIFAASATWRCSLTKVARARMRNITNRWTRAAGACFAS